MKVTNLTSPRTGAKVANQFSIYHNGCEYFQSYDTVIAKKDNSGYTISSNYNYSNTTSKYFSQWLKQWGYTDKEVDRLKKLLSASDVGSDVVLELDNGSKCDIHYCKADSFNL